MLPCLVLNRSHRFNHVHCGVVNEVLIHLPSYPFFPIFPVLFLSLFPPLALHSPPLPFPLPPSLLPPLCHIVWWSPPPRGQCPLSITQVTSLTGLTVLLRVSTGMSGNNRSSFLKTNIVKSIIHNLFYANA